jgi:hypothetical protein
MAKAKGIDKETLQKNAFWIVLGVFVLFWLISVITLKVSASDKMKKDWEAAEKDIKASQNPKNEKYLEPWRAHGEKFSKHKDKIWQEAWNQQKDMYTWPESMPVLARPLYPTDSFGKLPNGTIDANLDLNMRSKFRTDWYLEQFVDLDKTVYPVEFDGGFENVFPPQEWDPRSTPKAEEIWLAQEDFWVRREMLFIISQALDSVAKFQPQPLPKEPLPEGIVGRKIFRSVNWELDLFFEKSKDGRSVWLSDRSTIKNVSLSHRTLVLANPRTNQGIRFQFRQGEKTYDLVLAGEPLAYDNKVAFKRISSANPSPVDLTKDFQVEQVLEWETSPIRRIDYLEVAHHSHRTVTYGLKVNEVLKKMSEEGAEPSETAAAPTPPSAGPGGSPMPGMMPGGPGGDEGGMGGVSADDVTPVNQIPRKRYMHITPQCRHLPIAMRVVVDQNHVHDLLTAVANSRLRIQVTQVTLHHVRDVQSTAALGSGYSPDGQVPGSAIMRPPGGKPMGPGAMMPPGGMMPPPGGPLGTGGRAGSRPGSNPFARPGSSGGMMMPPGGMFPPGSEGSGLGRPAEQATQYVDNARLVECSIYGIASLYERFPPKQETPAEATTPGATTTPGK